MSARSGGGATATLAVGVLAFRWAAVAWMAILAVTGRESFVREPLAWGALAATATWVVVLTWRWSRPLSTALWIDLGLCLGLLAVSAYVAPEGSIEDRPLFAAAYPFAAVVGWGARWGVAGGLVAGAVVAVGYVTARPLNGVPLEGMNGDGWPSLANGAVNFVIAGGAVGMVSMLLQRSAEEVRDATQQAIAAREHAARSVEREALGRTIHDSVLQSLALINKRSRELAAKDPVSAADVSDLGQLAARQERDLRRLVLRDPEPAPAGTASLRELLESATAEVDGVTPAVSAAGSLWVPTALASEVVSATREALANVSKHASARHATVFAAIEDGHVVVAIRDDGTGFEYDEERLRLTRRAGVLRSMKGRIEDLGGTMRIETAPGRGTEVEFRVPLGAR
jgi:signal transduction histidine kinase